MSKYDDVNPLDAGAFEIHHATVNDGVELAFAHEGIGGVPLLLLHGYPGTKRIFYRNIGPLADAGFEVVVPDAAGWGDSPIPERYSDPISSALDFVALMQQLGHERWVLGGFDFGSMSALHMVNRDPERIIRLVLWNALVPLLDDEYERAGVGGNMIAENAEVSSHIWDHGVDPDAFTASFADDDQRRRYIMDFYQGRAWREGDPIRHLAGPTGFDDTAAAFHSDPFAEAARFRAAAHYYAWVVSATRGETHMFVEPPLLDRKVTPETLFMFGVEDDILAHSESARRKYLRRAELGFANLVGPFVVEPGGHFLSWERADIVNGAIRSFCRDLLPA